MRATKQAAPQPWRRRGLFTGIPSGSLVIGVPACPALTVLPGSGTGAGWAADAFASDAWAAAPSDAGSEAGGDGAGATLQPTASASPTILASATPCPSISATPVASANCTAPANSKATALAGRITSAVRHKGVVTGCGESFRITDIHGEQLPVDRTAVQPDVAQPTGVRFTRP
ncbi:conserved hypothetical protein [Streptomyces sviceus ATCC 29083]|uniref:Uncharacterized protein n=1 Tax=Streptomyces sviceus (strain ATCC 29083 / DSM 924 / JCM 4929 / NBRC 13980 / NCIMB 11184 / NRRL 5439 / UC 5370) TaxID=463191 RepID=B5HRG5_STRX2|nr:conserved hypothetical protein [Streptomyces sviceus ATCC 29083]